MNTMALALATLAAAAVMILALAAVPAARRPAATAPAADTPSSRMLGPSPARRERALGVLEQSGNPKGWTVEQYLAQCVSNAALLGGGAAVGVLAVGVLLTLPPALTLALAVPAAALGARSGWSAPRRTLERAAIDRQHEALIELPSLLVTMATSMAASNTVLNALREATAELPPGTLRGELDLLLARLDHGDPLPAALLAFRARLPVAGIEETGQKILDAARTGARADTAMVDLATKLTREAAALRRLLIQKVKLEVMFITIVLLAPAVGLFLMFPIVRTTFAQLGGLT